MFPPFYEILKPQLLSLPPANEVWGKVIFLHLSVILFTGGVHGKVPPWQVHPPAGTPPAGTPPRQLHPRTGTPPPWAGTPPPWAGTPPLWAGIPPWTGTPTPGRYALPQQCMLAAIPLGLENWKNRKAFSSQGKVREFRRLEKSGKIQQNTGKLR